MIEGALMAAVGVAGILSVMVAVLSLALVRLSRQKSTPQSYIEELTPTAQTKGKKRFSVPILKKTPPSESDSVTGTSRDRNRELPPKKHSMFAEIFRRKSEFTEETLDEIPEGVAGSEAEGLGRLNFGLSYDKDTQTLCVHIMEAVGLPAMDFCGSSDPYVRCCLYPEPNCPVKVTRVHRRSRNPNFNQSIEFPGYSLRKLEDLCLCLQVMDFDRFTRDDPIGEILLPMKSIKLEHCPVYWKTLLKPIVHKDEQGEIMLSLCYSPENSKISVAIIKARGLPAKDITGSSDPYVKVWLLEYGVKVEKRKTMVRAQTLAPVFNESFSFQVAPEKLSTCLQLGVTVMDHDIIGSNDEMGHVILGTKGSDSGQKHWKEMLDKPNYPVAMWHHLSPKW